LQTDDLYKAWSHGALHRNFMGYTTQSTKFLLGLGVSSISDTGNAFAQNKKTLHDYYGAIEEGKFAIKKGYILTDEDLVFKKYILDISCKGSTEFLPSSLPTLEKLCFSKLDEFAKDGLIEWNTDGLKLAGQGRYFLRNICSVFDLYMQRSNPTDQIFSKAI